MKSYEYTLCIVSVSVKSQKLNVKLYVTYKLALHQSWYIRVLLMKLAYKHAVICSAKSCPDNTCYESSVKTFSSMSALNVHFSPLGLCECACAWLSMCAK